MDNDSVLEQIVKSLSFEVEAIPQDDIIQLTTTTKSTPLNVKIRVRKKDDAGFQHGVLSWPKSNQSERIPERVRLVSSDQTIMSFNVVMEADFQKPDKKPRKNMFSIFKPTICLGTRSDEDKYTYLPSKSTISKDNEESSSNSEWTQAKNEDTNRAPATLLKKNKDIFGKYKPGGCLDPPFGEDKHPYTLTQDNEQKTIVQKKVTKETEQTVRPTIENKVRTSSDISNKLSNWKRKSSNDEVTKTNVIKKDSKAESVLDLYQAGSLQASTTFSHSIMTYPPTLNSSEQLPIQEEKQRGSRVYNISSRNSINVHSGSYFVISKKVKNALDKNAFQIEDDANDLKIISKTKLQDKNTIAQHQDLENDKNKNSLQTKNDVSSDSKIIKGSVQKPNFKDNLAPAPLAIVPLGIITTILTNPDHTELNEVPPDNDNRHKDPQNENSSIVSRPDHISKQHQVLEENKNILQSRESIIDVRYLEKEGPLKSDNQKSSIQELIFINSLTPSAISPIIPNIDCIDSNDIHSEKNAGHKKPKKLEDSTVGKSERSSVQYQDFVIQANESVTDVNEVEKCVPSKSENQKVSMQKPSIIDDLAPLAVAVAPLGVMSTILTNTDLIESNNLSLDKDKQKEPQIQEELTFIKTESNNILADENNVFIKPQISEDTHHTESNNIPVLDKEIPKEQQNQYQNLIPQIPSTPFYNIDLQKQEILVDKQPDTVYETLTDTYLNPNNYPESRSTENNVITKENISLSETSIENQKPTSINAPSFEILNEIDNLVLSHIEGEKELGDKPTVTIDDQNELTDDFLKYTDTKSTILNERKKSDPENEESAKISASVEKVISSDMIQIESNDLQQNWEVKDNSLETKHMDTDNDSNKHRDSLNSFKPLPETKELIHDKAQEIITQEYDVFSHNKNNLVEDADIQDKIKDTKHGSIDNYKTVDSARTTINQTDSAAMDMDIIESVKKIGDSGDDSFVQQPIVDDVLKINIDTLEYNYDIKEFYIKKDTTDPPSKKYNIVPKIDTLKDPQLSENKDNNVVAVVKEYTKQNKVGVKNIKNTLDDDFISENDCILKIPDSDYNLNPNSDCTRIKARPEAYDKLAQDEYSATKAPGIITKHKARPIMINFATQSYVDDNNQVIIKSFEASNLPKRYPHDAVRITKRYVDVDDKIHIPINSENDNVIMLDMYIEIKNKQWGTNELNGCYKDTDITRKNIITKKSEDELDEIERNVIIAEDIRKTLVAVYEQELLPLRNTILELKDNLEMLTANHLLLKGHMFARKPKFNKIAPLYKKCMCMKK